MSTRLSLEMEEEIRGTVMSLMAGRIVATLLAEVRALREDLAAYREKYRNETAWRAEYRDAERALDKAGIARVSPDEPGEDDCVEWRIGLLAAERDEARAERDEARAKVRAMDPLDPEYARYFALVAERARLGEQLTETFHATRGVGLEDLDVPESVPDTVAAHVKWSIDVLARQRDEARSDLLTNKKTVVHTVGGLVEGAPTHTGNYLQRLRQLVAVEKIPVALEWRDISSAPKDAPEVLLSAPGWSRPSAGRWDHYRGGWALAGREAFPYVPTHWMPFPTPPQIHELPSHDDADLLAEPAALGPHEPYYLEPSWPEVAAQAQRDLDAALAALEQAERIARGEHVAAEDASRDFGASRTQARWLGRLAAAEDIATKIAALRAGLAK